ncbi:hypothetical protein D3C85_1335620 [compost metagenome]
MDKMNLTELCEWPLNRTQPMCALLWIHKVRQADHRKEAPAKCTNHQTSCLERVCIIIRLIERQIDHVTKAKSRWHHHNKDR